MVNNLIDHRFNSVVQVQSIGKSTYEALQLQAIKVFSHGLSYQASYTYGHAMDDVSDALPVFANDSAMVQNPQNISASWGPSAFDVAQRFVSNGLFEVPWTKRFTGVEGQGATRLGGRWDCHRPIRIAGHNFERSGARHP